MQGRAVQHHAPDSGVALARMSALLPRPAQGFPCFRAAHDTPEVILARISAAHTKPKAGCECTGVGRPVVVGGREGRCGHTPLLAAVTIAMFQGSCTCLEWTRRQRKAAPLDCSLCMGVAAAEPPGCGPLPPSATRAQADASWSLAGPASNGWKWRPRAAPSRSESPRGRL